MLPVVALLAIGMSDSARLERARDLYLDSRFNEALGILRGIVERHEVSAAEREDALLIAATSHIALDDHAQAKFYLRELLRGRAGYTLPKGTSPKVREVFAEVQATRAPAEPKITTLGPTTAPGLAAPVSVESRPLYTRWWLWTAVGVVAAAGAVTAIVLATRPTTASLALHVTPP